MKLFVKIILICVIISGCQNYHSKKEGISETIGSKIAPQSSEKNPELFHTIKSLDSLFLMLLTIHVIL
jgi:PBP1b-binding outer membrane lipoprotein LpoB